MPKCRAILEPWQLVVQPPFGINCSKVKVFQACTGNMGYVHAAVSVSLDWHGDQQSTDRLHPTIVTKV